MAKAEKTEFTIPQMFDRLQNYCEALMAVRDTYAKARRAENVSLRLVIDGEANELNTDTPAAKALITGALKQIAEKRGQDIVLMLREIHLTASQLLALLPEAHAVKAKATPAPVTEKAESAGAAAPPDADDVTPAEGEEFGA